MVQRSKAPSSRTSVIPGTAANASGGGGEPNLTSTECRAFSRSPARLSVISRRPDRMMATRSAIRSTSDRTCEDSITAAPASTRSRRIAWNSC